MSKECKVARNVVGGSMLILLAICTLLSMSSCGTSYSTCAAYTMSANGTGGNCSR